MKCQMCEQERPLSDFYCVDQKQGLYSRNCVFCMFTSWQPIPLEGSHKSCDKKNDMENSKLTHSTTTARNLARRLSFEHDKKERTWREISKDYSGVKFGVLNRIAKSKGRWTPKDEKVRTVLGLAISKPREKKPIPIIGIGHNWESVFFKPLKKRSYYDKNRNLS